MLNAELITSTGRVSFGSIPRIFNIFNADIAVTMPKAPSNMPASMTVSCMNQRTASDTYKTGKICSVE